MSGRQLPPVLLHPHQHPQQQQQQQLLPLSEILLHNRNKIKVLKEDHREMLSTHAALKQDLSVADQQLHKLAAAARKVRDEREYEVKKVYERSLSIESQLRGVDALVTEHHQVVADIHKLNDSKVKLQSEFMSIDNDLQRVKVEMTDVDDLKGDVDAMRLELQKGRAAVEFEKKTRAANLEQYQAMERNMVSMKNEIEKLREELADAEKRARAAAAAASNPDPGYMGNYRGPDMVFQGGHSSHYPMHQAVPAEVYRPPTDNPVLFEMHQTHGPKG